VDWLRSNEFECRAECVKGCKKISDDPFLSVTFKLFLLESGKYYIGYDTVGIENWVKIWYGKVSIS